MSTRTNNILWVIGILAVTLFLACVICTVAEWEKTEHGARQAENTLRNARMLSGRCEYPCKM